MPFIPHTAEDVASMLKVIDAPSIEALFDEIPSHLRITELPEMPAGLSSMALLRAMQERAKMDIVDLNFIGAGAYEHHIPAVVWDIASRGEFMTAYTPYQAEASQGTLQLLYEYQSMMANLMAMDVSNASLYDGATALAEAILMAIRIKGSDQIVLPSTVHPYYRQVVKTLLEPLGAELIELPYCLNTGKTVVQDLEAFRNCAALVIPQPNFLGVLEDVHVLTNWAHAKGALVIGVVNPVAMALFSPPGEWGNNGADIACGEGQPLGVPMASGGPYFGFFCCKKEYIRQMPGRLIGRTRDAAGKMGFTLTLQAREQHIRRAKAKSNICTNQGLLVTAATIFMSIMGAQGLYNIAAACYTQTKALSELLVPLEKSEGIRIVFKQDFFHELVLSFPCPVETIIQSLAKQGIQAGFDLTPVYHELGNCLLVCVTETKTREDLMAFVSALKATVIKEAKVCQEAN